MLKCCKRKTILSILGAFLFLLVSCNNISDGATFSDDVNKKSGPQVVHITATVQAEGVLPAEMNLPPAGSGRSALASLPAGADFFYQIHVENAADSSDFEDYYDSVAMFTFPLVFGTWKITANMYLGDSETDCTEDNLLFTGTKELELSSASPLASSLRIAAEPSLTGGGVATLDVSISADSGIKSALVSWPAKGGLAAGSQVLDYTALSSQEFNFDGLSTVPSGAHKVTINFYDGPVSSGLPTGNVVFVSYQTVNVVNKLNTTSWKSAKVGTSGDAGSSGSGYISPSGVFNVTKQAIEVQKRTEFFVDSSSEGGAFGTPYDAFKTFEEAFNMISDYSLTKATIKIKSGTTVSLDQLFTFPAELDITIAKYGDGENPLVSFTDATSAFNFNGKYLVDSVDFGTTRTTTTAIFSMSNSSNGTLKNVKIALPNEGVTIAGTSICVIDSCDFNRTSVSGGSFGILQIQKGDVTIKNSTFENKSNNLESITLDSTAKLRLENSKITSGAIGISSQLTSTLEMSKCVISGVKTGISWGSTKECIIENSDFSNCSVNGVEITSGTVTFKSGKISGCGSGTGTDKSAVLVRTGAKFVLENGQIVQNAAYGILNNGNITLKSGKISGNADANVSSLNGTVSLAGNTVVSAYSGSTEKMIVASQVAVTSDCTGTYLLSIPSEDCFDGATVLTGTFDSTKFSVDIPIWGIDVNGQLELAIATYYYVDPSISDDSTGKTVDPDIGIAADNPYGSLQRVIDERCYEGIPITIELLSDFVYSAGKTASTDSVLTVKQGQSITIVNTDGAGVCKKIDAAGLKDSVIKIEKGGYLEMESIQITGGKKYGAYLVKGPEDGHTGMLTFSCVFGDDLGVLPTESDYGNRGCAIYGEEYTSVELYGGTVSHNYTPETSSASAIYTKGDCILSDSVNISYNAGLSPAVVIAPGTTEFGDNQLLLISCSINNNSAEGSAKAGGLYAQSVIYLDPSDRIEVIDNSLKSKTSNVVLDASAYFSLMRAVSDTTIGVSSMTDLSVEIADDSFANFHSDENPSTIFKADSPAYYIDWTDASKSSVSMFKFAYATSSISFADDDVTFEIEKGSVFSGVETEINISAFLDKGAASQKDLTSDASATNWAIKVFSNGKDISTNEKIQINNVDAAGGNPAQRSVILKSDIPAGTPIQIVVSLELNGRTYGGSVPINII